MLVLETEDLSWDGAWCMTSVFLTFIWRPKAVAAAANWSTICWRSFSVWAKRAQIIGIQELLHQEFCNSSVSMKMTKVKQFAVGSEADVASSTIALKEQQQLRHYISK